MEDPVQVVCETKQQNLMSAKKFVKRTSCPQPSNSLIKGHLMEQVAYKSIKILEGPSLAPYPPLVPPALRKNHRLNDTWPVLPHSPPNVTVIMYFVFLSCHYMCSCSMFS